MSNYEKTKISITYRMLGAKWNTAYKAMNYAQTYHSGKRKDGEPEFSHQVWIANYAITLPLEYEIFDTLLAIIFLHDVCEDYPVLFEHIESLYGKEVRDGVEKVTKVINGEKLSNKVYFDNMIDNPLSCLAKGCDRLHNLSTMVNAFDVDKQKKQIQETEEFILPMIKKSRRLYPEYERAFENIKQSIESRIALIRLSHAKNNI